MNAVALRYGLIYAYYYQAPDGSQGLAVNASFSVVVQNLASTKLVGIWGSVGGTWGFTPCSYGRSVPGNLEIWTTPAGIQGPDPFDCKYQVLGNVYWDNNAGYNYNLDYSGGPSTTVVIGPNVLADPEATGPTTTIATGVDSEGNLHVGVLVKNLAYQKQVGIVYTIDNWQTFQYAVGSYLQSLLPASTPHQINAESWQIVTPVGVGATGQYAAFYTVAGTTYWDNNFGLNYPFAPQP